MMARRLNWHGLAPRRPSLWRIVWACTGMVVVAAFTAAIAIIRGDA